MVAAPYAIDAQLLFASASEIRIPRYVAPMDIGQLYRGLRTARGYQAAGLLCFWGLGTGFGVVLLRRDDCSAQNLALPGGSLRIDDHAGDQRPERPHRAGMDEGDPPNLWAAHQRERRMGFRERVENFRAEGLI
ncbi:hypothetical protein QE412_000799 [Microbacterium trichothecenolyticum]|uniref:Uncharacterized protein n=1 Tax=Microbacterium trichothecenolyticum TaxID=69370 RepID=A0ABU0TRC9_MICTR|nr:hypothetical protein [Microbacterium trichothecenolyticum]